MDTVSFVSQCLNQVHERLVKSLEGFKEEELLWRPAPQANCILEILWHLARSEDRMGRTDIGLGPDLWESQGWHKRFGYPKESEGDDYDVLKSEAYPMPRLDDIVEYLEAIHQDTQEKLSRLSPEDFDRESNPQEPGNPIAAYYRHTITHNNNHHGQIDYIRGLIQPGWDLTPGTGFVQE